MEILRDVWQDVIAMVNPNVNNMTIYLLILTAIQSESTNLVKNSLWHKEIIHFLSLKMLSIKDNRVTPLKLS